LLALGALGIPDPYYITTTMGGQSHAPILVCDICSIPIGAHPARACKELPVGIIGTPGISLSGISDDEYIDIAPAGGVLGEHTFGLFPQFEHVIRTHIGNVVES
jgi:hypothetical protein